MAEKQDTYTGSGDGKRMGDGERSTAAKSRPAQAGSASDNISDARGILALLQDDLSQYHKIGGRVAIIPKNGILAILIYPITDMRLGFDATGNITDNGEAVKYG